MSMRPVLPVWTVAAALLAAPALRAHHSVLGFDNTRGVTIEAGVLRLLWRNPHVMLSLQVETVVGSQHWVVEAEPPLVLEPLGWSKDVIRTGDYVTVLGAPAKDGSRRLRCKEVRLRDGRTLPCF